VQEAKSGSRASALSLTKGRRLGITFGKGGSGADGWIGVTSRRGRFGAWVSKRIMV